MLKFDKTKLNKALANNNILVPFLDRVFETFDEPWTFKYTEKGRDDAWHPSGDCTPGVSSLYAKAQGREPERISGSLRKSFMVGHYWHQLIQYIVVNKLHFAEPDAIEKRGERVWGTLWDDPNPKMIVPPAPYHWVTGQGDFAPLITPRWRGIVDIKTIGGEQYKTCESTKRLPDRFLKKYICQINIYMDLFDEEHGLILGVNKDSPHNFIEFKFERDQALIDAIYRKWKFVSQCLDDNVEPTEDDDKEYKLPL